jgi:glycosyltransferase involved in cell wall biosynthesis
MLGPGFIWTVQIFYKGLPLGGNEMANTIRVAMIIQDYYPMLGGAQRQIAALAPLLQAQQVEVFVLTRRYAGLSSFEQVDNVPVYRLPIPGPKPVAALSFILAALPLIKRLKPHVIHAHELLSPTSAAIAAKKLYHLPVVAKVLRGGSLGDLAKLKRKPFGQQRIASARRWVDMFITISQEIERELEQVGVLPEFRSFIPNGVDAARFVPLTSSQKQALRARLGLPERAPIVIFTGRLSSEKRVDQLISIWPSIRVAHPDARLLLLGTGHEEVRLKKMAGSGVDFLGLVEDVVPYLQISDLFVLPSTSEGLSNALLEALATGLPAVVSAVGGATDVIEHRKSGWLVKSDAVAELQNAISTLLSDMEYCHSMGRSARAVITQNYSLQMTAKSLFELYGRLSGKLES